MVSDTSSEQRFAVHRLLFPLGPLGSMGGATRQLSAMMIDFGRRVASYHADASHLCTQFTVRQMRAAMQVRDPESLAMFLQYQRQEWEELCRKLTECTQQLLTLPQDGFLETEAVTAVDTDIGQQQAAPEQAAQANRTPSSAVSTDGAAHARRAAAQRRGSGHRRQARRRVSTEPLPIEHYDRLTMRELERRLDGLPKREIRRLQEYESSHKNRPRFKQMLARHAE